MSNLSFLAAADTANMQAGGTSFFDTAADFATKGVAGAVVSGLHGILNTGVDLSNKVFNTELERADTANTLSKIDDSYGQYYKEHQGVLDVAGFVAGSLIPGGIAVKGLKMVQAGEATGVFSRALGYATRKESFYLNKALQDLAVEGGTVFTRINANKALSMAWGTADNILQAAAFETAAALSMSSSPMLEGKEWKDIGWDIVKTSMIGGAFGGGINALFTNKLVKDAGKLVEGKQRMYDVLKDTGDLNISFGDRAFGIVEAVMDLPKEVLDPLVKISVGKAHLADVTLDTTALMTKTLRESTQRGVQKFEAKLAHVVENDKTVGLALSSSLAGIVKEGLEAGVSDTAIRKQLGEYLLNLHSVEGIGNRPLSVKGSVVYLDPHADISKKTVMTTERQLGNTVAYRVIGDESTAKMGTLGKEVLTTEEAWKNGFDAIIDPKTKTVKISPFSSIYSKVDAIEEQYTPMFFNTVTKKTSFDTVPTVGDVQTGGIPIKVNNEGVQSGSRSFTFKTGIFNEPVDSVEATARHLWASKLTKVFGEVDVHDISMLEALRLNRGIAAAGVKIVDREGNRSWNLTDFTPDNFEMFVFKAKYETAIKLLSKNADATELRDVAYRLNVSSAWLEDAVGVKLGRKEMWEAKEGWQLNPGRYEARENLLFRYDTEAMQKSPAFPESIVAYHTRVKEAQERAENAAATVLGDEHYRNLIKLTDSLAADARSTNVGASLLGSSNAGYGDRLLSFAQYTGQQVGNIVNKRVSGALFMLQAPAARILQNPKAAAELSAAVTQARLSTDAMAIYQAPNKKWMLVDLDSYKAITKHGGKLEFKKRIDLSDEAGEFIQEHHYLHSARVEQQNVLAAAQGYATKWDPDRLYMPPVDTQRVPFHAFVRQSDGTIFGSSEVAMITARNAGELQALAAQVEKTQGLTVLYKSNTEEYFKAKRDYDFMRTLNSPTIDSTLRKEGQLGDYLPNMTPEAVVEDFVQYTQRAETKLVRDAISVNYGQTIAELTDLSKRYTAVQTSKFEGLSKLLQRGVTDPFNDAIKLMLNISKRSEFTLWHEANEFVDALGTKAFQAIEKATLDARGGKISFQEANDQLEKFGLGRHYTDEMAFDVAQHAQDRNLIKTTLHKANMLLANGMLRLDFANSLLNIVSTPILLGTEVSAIRSSLRNDPELFARFGEMMSEQVPGTAVRIPSAVRLLANAVGSYASGESKALMQRFKDIGTVKGPAALFHEMMGDLALTPKMVPSEFASRVNSWVEKGASLTFSNQAEDMTRYVTSHVMMQLTDPIVKAGKMSIQEQNAFMTIFTNRVQGNYVASQRPILFQGTIGAAIGLFQTYQFNLFQQLFRHIENKDAKTVAVMAALQGTLFGANGLPLFHAINTHVVGSASINSGHKDAYSYATQAVGKEWGDWLMYGTASAFPAFSDQAPALFTRGDLNPRSVFIVPTSPMDVPAVQASLKVVNAVIGMASQVSKGSDVKDALLFGLEHNGINRPLAGLAQVLQGHATTNKGNLIAAAGDWDSIATAARLIGAKPMDESIAMTTQYRSRAYQAMDKEKIDALGTVVKGKLRDNKTITSEDWIDLQGKYAASGGRVQGFTQAVRRWDKASNTSLVNEVMRHSQTPAGGRMIEAMGGDPLRDYRTETSEEE